MGKSLRSCSFCGKDEFSVRKLIAGPGQAHICDACVGLCAEALSREFPEFRRRDPTVLEDLPEGEEGGISPPVTSASKPLVLRALSPAGLKAQLDEYIVGQEMTKKTLAVAVHNHYKRLVAEGICLSECPLANLEDEALKEVEIEKSNILLIGPTGSGKTLLARTLARILEVPFAITDATTLTEAGYVGEDVENIILCLLQAADYDVKRAECGIIYIDEIDKIGRKTDNVSISRDVSGEGVQQALLKILEGTDCHVPPKGGRKHPEQEYVRIRTDHILFICGGAFVGLDKIVSERIGRKAMGFGARKRGAGDAVLEKNPLLETQSADLIRFGLIPEFVGRLPVVTVLAELGEEDFRHILSEPKNALIRQYTKLLALEGTALYFEPEAIQAIVEQALRSKTGARALCSILESVMFEIMYRLPANGKAGETTDHVTITRATVEEQLKTRTSA
jgi:ATP-dependent Clp protease ATP-binding subunit ClpX